MTPEAIVDIVRYNLGTNCGTAASRLPFMTGWMLGDYVGQQIERSLAIQRSARIVAEQTKQLQRKTQRFLN